MWCGIYLFDTPEAQVLWNCVADMLIFNMWCNPPGRDGAPTSTFICDC